MVFPKLSESGFRADLGVFHPCVPVLQSQGSQGTSRGQTGQVAGTSNQGLDADPMSAFLWPPRPLPSLHCPALLPASPLSGS